MFAVVKIANLQRPCKKITVEYLAWFMENILGSRLHGIAVWKTCKYVGSKVSYTCRYMGITRCVIYSSTLFNFCYLFQAYVIRTRNIECPCF